jgi:hypothetical protein
MGENILNGKNAVLLALYATGQTALYHKCVLLFETETPKSISKSTTTTLHIFNTVNLTNIDRLCLHGKEQGWL